MQKRLILSRSCPAVYKVVWLLIAWQIVIACRVEALLQIRTSKLRPWLTTGSPDKDHIGWIREERDTKAKSYRVLIGKGECNINDQDATANHANDDDNNDVLSLSLPFFEDQSALGATLWSSGLALGILGHAHAAFGSHLVSKQRVLELGAGLGLPGRVFVTQGAQHVTLTDNDPQVVEQNLVAIQAEKEDDPANSNDNHVTARRLEWRDTTEQKDGNEPQESSQQEEFDIIVGADVAYYFFLLRPLMDTIQHYRTISSKSTCLILGQANRESQWDLYRNIRDGCYNQLTDKHEDPWPGQVQMLLYNLDSQNWHTPGDVHDIKEGILPISAIIHQSHPDDGGQLFSSHLTSIDYVATGQDERSLEMTF